MRTRIIAQRIRTTCKGINFAAKSLRTALNLKNIFINVSVLFENNEIHFLPFSCENCHAQLLFTNFVLEFTASLCNDRDFVFIQAPEKYLV